MAFRVLHAADAFWRPSNRMAVDNTNLAQQLGAEPLGDDTDAPALWLVVGAPTEDANTLEMTPELIARLYPDGPKALPPELSQPNASD